MSGLLVLVLTLAGVLFALPALAPAPAAAAETGGFYCGGATTLKTCLPCRADKGQSCGPGSFVAGTTRRIFASIDNQAAGGEMCRIYREHFGYLDPVWFNAGDYGAKYMGTVYGGNRYEIRCIRRAASGDAGIGGYTGFGD